ncbi:MAG: hypothetical protein IT374_11945 [Polyangiaceae bacterium]|nr:hypothetical protein [Polyangiaceae bacterium]
MRRPALLASVLTGLALAAACASGSDAGDASNEAAGPGAGGLTAAGGSPSAGGASSTAGADGGALPDSGAFPEAGPQAGAAGAAGTSGGGGSTAGGGGGGSTAGGAGSGAAGSGGAAGTAGSAGAPCTPQCAGKQCGSDGCNGVCGACSSAQSCDTGKCVDVCKSSWKSTLAGVGPTRVAVDAGTLYVAGSKANQGYLGAVDACTGALTASQTTLVGSGSRLLSLQLSPTHVYAAGQGAHTGLLVRALRGSLTLEASDPLVGSADGDEVWDVTPTAGGNLWMAGAAAVDKTAGFWIVQGPIGGGACGFAAFPGVPSHGRAAVSGGGKVFVVGQREQDGVVARYADQSCMTVTPCSCAPEQSVSLKVGLTSTEVRHAAYAGGKLFVVGFGADGANGVSFLSRLDANTLAVEATFKSDPTPAGDGFLAVAVDAGVVYVGGLRGWQGEASFATATAQLLAIPATFGPTASPTWVHEPAGARAAWGVAAQGGAVYASLQALDGALMKCPASGCQ